MAMVVDQSGDFNRSKDDASSGWSRSRGYTLGSIQVGLASQLVRNSLAGAHRCVDATHLLSTHERTFHSARSPNTSTTTRFAPFSAPSSTFTTRISMISVTTVDVQSRHIRVKT